jgi:hypothetical protein
MRDVAHAVKTTFFYQDTAVLIIGTAFIANSEGGQGFLQFIQCAGYALVILFWCFVAFAGAVAYIVAAAWLVVLLNKAQLRAQAKLFYEASITNYALLITSCRHIPMAYACGAYQPPGAYNRAGLQKRKGRMYSRSALTIGCI